MGKFCAKCGTELGKDATFCANCGQATETKVEKVTTDSNAPASNGFAIAGFVLSFFVSELGLVFSIIGLNKAKSLNGSGRGLAKAGLILSIIGLVFQIIAVIFYYLIVVAAVVGASYY